MASATSLVLGVMHILFLIGRTEGASCSSNQISCRTGNQCVSLGDVCRGGSHQCADGSDEDPQICSFWKPDSRCGRGQFYCSGLYGCTSLATACSNSCGINTRICELIASKILKLKKEEEDREETGLSLTEELVSLMQQAVNATSNVSVSCPMFYSRIGDACLSFFAPAKVPWPEARQFCLSIGGDLIAIKGIVDHEKLLGYMQRAQLTTDFWIGGRFDVDTNSWSWVLDDTPLPLGAPFWATRYSSSCVPRSPPHTDPFNPAPTALPKAPCFNYVQAPAQRSAGWCAAMTYEHYYYFTDEECQENRSPLCLFQGRPRQKQVDTTVN
ncbi:uncharacterized protein LOC135224333 [Macrobrachium nipponense]|uniref:uncharacterized protein LOC135224333 n=1 Tax=Macrobrachium nipponense TaxID=159736 RepID=UPI0030C8AC7E